MNTEFCVSEVMANTTVLEGVPTKPARAMELLEELYQLYNINFKQPLRPTEFISLLNLLKKVKPRSRGIQSLITWKNKNDVDRATKATSTKDLQNSETTNEETPL